MKGRRTPDAGRLSRAAGIIGLALMLLGAAQLAVDTYDRVRVGMTIEEVKGVLGEPATSLSAGEEVTVLQWRTADGTALATVTARQGKVVGKSSYALIADSPDRKLQLSAAAAVISLVSLGVSCFVFWWSSTFNERLLRRATRYDFTRLLMDIDKILIDKPELWAVYKTRAELLPTGTINERETARLRREALIYMFLNLFATVFDFYEHIASKSPDEKRQAVSWDRYMREFVSGSPEAQAICNRKDFDNLYGSDFTTHVRAMIPKKDVAGSPLASR